MKCPACHNEEWSIIYEGPVRVGKGDSEKRTIFECLGCSVQRMDTFYDPANYQDGTYRKGLKEESWDHKFHDTIYKFFVNELPSLRNRVVVDVGCGNGGFIEHIEGVALVAYGVEPDTRYHGNKSIVASYPHNAPQGKADVATAFDVIEHTENPVKFLREVKDLLSPGGRVFIATPNRDDILMHLLPEYKAFWYKTAHNWFFSANSLKKCVLAAGLSPVRIWTPHRHGIGNTLGWLKHRRPVGDKMFSFLTKSIDNAWRSYLEANDLGEWIFIECGRRD